MTPHQGIEMAASLALQAAFVVLVTESISRTVRSARVKDRLWSACLVALLALPVADLVLPHLRLLPAPSAPVNPDARQAAWSEAVLVRWLFAVWLAGAAMLSVRLLLDLWRTVRLLRLGTPLPDAVLDDLRTRLAAEALAVAPAGSLGVKGKTVGIFVCDSLRSPSCWQLHRPRIVLPAALLAFPAEELALIVRHELAHLRTGHPLLLFIQRLVEIVFWMHPAAWWASRQSARAREFVCDDAAVESRRSAAVYVRTLLRMLSNGERWGASSATALSFGAPRRLVVERAERLASLDWTAPVARPGRGWRVAVPWVSAATAMLLLWAPLDGAASRRSVWSPWPGLSARVLQCLGVPVRDYEVDGYRLHPKELRRWTSPAG